MKRATCLILFGILFSLIAWADPCKPGTLADYEALGVTGCTIGSNLLSSFVTLAGTTGATELAESDISIQPLGGTSDPELDFSTSQTVEANQLLETIFTYKISGNPFTQSQIVLSKSSETGDGAVTDLQNLCSDGTFGPDGVSGCTGTPAALAALDGFQNSDQTPLAALAFLSVTDDFTLDGGTAGGASGGWFADQFKTGAAVPEPKAVSFLAVFAIALTAILRRRRTAS